MPDIIKEAEYIRNMVSNGMYDISTHATQRMNERNMFFDEMEDIILNHKFKLAKDDGNNERYEFYTNTKDKIIVALGSGMMIPVIVTVIKGGSKNE
ncbi:MAG: hypothetical protein IJS47_05270 [Clostridia bacterium]|nr:hypothetical protein [Clostridia bacterium]